MTQVGSRDCKKFCRRREAHLNSALWKVSICNDDEEVCCACGDNVRNCVIRDRGNVCGRWYLDLCLQEDVDSLGCQVEQDIVSMTEEGYGSGAMDNSDVQSGRAMGRGDVSSDKCSSGKRGSTSRK